jgi:pyruvate/2-oxoglutarate dehydrogenase complex dihydrolipoamide dehydrogenase (E3) component
MVNKFQKFDLIVIGGGSAGYAAARTYHDGGCTVAVVDEGHELGGLCILRGCMPSKTLLYSAEILHLANQGRVFGFEDVNLKADLPAMQLRKQKIIAEFADYRAEQLKDGRFSLYRSRAHFIDAFTIELCDGTFLQADKFLIATGSGIAMPPVPGLSKVNFKTSDDVLSLSKLPEETIVLGGGIVACELSQFLSRVGSRVTLLQRGKNILRGFPLKASECIRARMTGEGMDILTGVSIESLRQVDTNKIQINYIHEGEAFTQETRFLFHALGRTPKTKSLNLGKIGVEVMNSGHIATNSFQQTSIPHIYAAGDCAGPHEIVHIAIRQGETAALHALGKSPEPVSYDHLLGVTFTDPQIATVGLMPANLEERGIEFLSADYPFDDHGKSILMEAKSGYVAVHADKKNGVVLGAECVGKDAGELIHALSIAVSLKATVHQLVKADWYHPTLSEIWTYPIEDLAEQIFEGNQKK